MFSDVLEWAGLAALCMAAALGSAIWIQAGRGGSSRWRQVSRLPEQSEPVFLFDEDTLMDSSAAGRALLDADETDGTRVDISDLAVLRTVLGKRFLGLDTLDAVEDEAVFAARDSLDGYELLAERLDGILRLEVRPIRLPGLANSRSPAALHALEVEYDTLRGTMDMAPYPIWRVNDGGEVSWFNAAYADLFHRTHGTRPHPGQRLFQSALDTKPSGSRIRASISIPGQDNFFWYDVWITRHDGYRMFYAVDVGAVVNAETAQRNFVQTLTKTFAQLSIGLAIFDRNRQLALFNPALIDLTALPADFLSARPNLLSFFDRLRDGRMMPEPKDYRTWRDQMADLVAAAADGSYRETWSLPSGSIYQVSGRPHPDGAVAFLFEDITAEVSLTRRFRSELEISQSILDHVDDAIAVFGANGVLTLSNAAYRELWNADPDSSFAEVTIFDTTRDWQSRSMPTPVWGDLREFVSGTPDRSTWWANVTLNSGEDVACTVHPIQDGATLVCFRRTGLKEDGGSVAQLSHADAR
ncbi:MAG: diguanylate cyclase [Rhodobacteraceae bacterium]|nr:diguanylate cyclase [Paracoccaceae bacterium]